MKHFLLSLTFSLLSTTVFCQYDLPKSWESLEVTTIDKVDTTYLDTFYLPDKASDTVRLSVRMDIIIAKNGLIKTFDIYKTYVTNMDELVTLNQQTIKQYEERVMKLYEYLQRERIVYKKPKNREFKISENRTYHVSAKDIYLN